MSSQPISNAFTVGLLGELVNDEYIEYDGSSGAHLVLFNIFDYFLGLEPFFEEQDFMKYFSYSQRRFMASIKAHAFRPTAEQANNTGLVHQSEKIAKQLRVSSRETFIIS